MIDVPALLVTVRIALPMFASTRKAAPHAMPWRNVAASLVWRGPQKDGVVSLFARGHRPVMAVINAGRAWKANSARGSRWTPPSDVSLQRCIHGPRYVVQGILWQAHVRPCPHYGKGRGGRLVVRRRLETRLQR